MLSLKISETDTPAGVQKLTDVALACLNRHTETVGGVVSVPKSVSVLALLEERLVGGLIGKIGWNWLYADLVWVEEEFRRQGIGRRVMIAAEDRAREMSLTGIFLWTESWQAPVFYTKLGYSQFVEFTDFPPGHRRFGFRKYLA